MLDPYKVLGVSPNASDEDVKAAYRELAKKYHPDNYANNPLADLASEKMQEINEAYDAVQQMRKNGGNAGANAGTGGYSAYSSYNNSSQFADIRRMINAQRISEAEELLDGVMENSRDAEWYFLKGSIYYSRGWLNEALNFFSKAASMNPSNPEYRAALNQMMYQRQTGNPYGGYRTTSAPTGGCDICGTCTTLWCADCCCECFGCDLCGCF